MPGDGLPLVISALASRFFVGVHIVFKLERAQKQLSIHTSSTTICTFRVFIAQRPKLSQTVGFLLYELMAL